MIVVFFILFGFGYVFYILWIRHSESDGAPFIPLEPDVVERIVQMAEMKKGDTFYDLGSGDGRLVIAAAMKGAKAIGIETDALRVFYSRIWIRLLRLEKHAKIIHGDIFKQDYSHATVVHTYLLQETNNRLQGKLDKELKKGTRIVSSAFTFDRFKLQEINHKGTPYGPLYLYKK